MKRRDWMQGVAGVAAAAAFPSAFANDWAPSRPIKLVIGFAPGGPMDQFGRAIGERLGQRLGQPVVMEYKPGGGQVIAAEHVLRSPADGLTLFLTSSTLGTNALLTKVSFDPVQSFTHLVHIADIDVVVSVNSKLVPARTAQEFLAWAKEAGDKAFYALPTKGGTGHLVGELINKRGGLKMQPVFYRGTAPMMTDVVAGQVPLVIETIASVREFAKPGGAVSLIASSGSGRVPGYPNLPTLSESVFPGFDCSAWYCMMLAANTPKEIVARLNRELNVVLGDPGVANLFTQGGASMRGGSPEAATRMLEERQKLTAQIIKDADIKV